MLAASIDITKLNENSITVTAGEGLNINEEGPIPLGGDITIKVNVDDNSIEVNEDKLMVKNEGIKNDMLEGLISNDKLLNNTISINAGNGLIGGGNIYLGGDVTLDVDVDNSSIELDITTQKVKVKNGGITNDMLAGSIDLPTKTIGVLPINSIPYTTNMSLNSTIHVPTQGSVKTYVDTEISNLINTSSDTLNTLNAISSLLNT